MKVCKKQVPLGDMGLVLYRKGFKLEVAGQREHSKNHRRWKNTKLLPT